MTHEEIFKRENGDSVMIRVDVWLDHNEPKYSISLALKPKNKRKWQFITHDSYEYRRLNMNDRKAYEIKECLQHATADEILQAKLALWNKMKP